MFEASVRRILERLGPDDVVLDIGGWGRPFTRADWVMDLQPYDTRGLYGHDGPLPERFTADTWIVRDICDREPYPFADGELDFVICSHTLEDVRDPIWVCREMARIAKAGYIEVPSRLEEQSRGFQGDWVGWGHHRWLVDDVDGRLEFVFKHHVLHNRPSDHFPPGFRDALSEEQRVLRFWWDGGFEALERVFVLPEELDPYLADFVAAHRDDVTLPVPPAPKGAAAVARRALRPAARTARSVLGRVAAGRAPQDDPGDLTDPEQRQAAFPPDYDEASRALFEAVKPYTLTSHERVNALRLAVEYVVDARVPGAIVECGVWRGGSMLAVALTLLAKGDTDRDLYLFDTFTAMPEPGPDDVDVHGRPVSEYLDEMMAHPYFSYLPLEEVQRVVLGSGYPAERVHFVQGLVEDTIPDQAPATIALCRLDTDFYASTAHEMAHLFPRISPGGVLIVDDYGEFQGARKAVDEHLAASGTAVLLHRVDQGGRVAIVPGG